MKTGRYTVVVNSYTNLQLLTKEVRDIFINGFDKNINRLHWFQTPILGSLCFLDYHFFFRTVFTVSKGKKTEDIPVYTFLKMQTYERWEWDENNIDDFPALKLVSLVFRIEKTKLITDDVYHLMSSSLHDISRSLLLRQFPPRPIEDIFSFDELSVINQYQLNQDSKLNANF